ncbi:melanoma-associated antigen B10-like [Erinaceus europaeus]|uniref:Melanoma-associated antigen B10-like n=1 Tax=Erinaceus europaeus TaxID=9365 RepID=A0ABM3WSJ4_ERIEU|nr:melanoma-associated antigen B10-like [Erinaceus europaeus]XP_060039543.1 melanoma-associated antigen B10-like [Erinaceus europaeus]
MPRGHKSKLRAREKRRKARSDTQSLQDVQATEDKQSLSSASLSGGKPQKSSVAVPGSKTRGSRKVNNAGPSSRKSGEGAKSRNDERPSTSQALSHTDHPNRRPIDQKAIMLVQFMVRKHNNKEPITKADILKHVIKKHSAHFNEIFTKASELMVLAFGIDVLEVDSTQHYYVLVSKLQSSRNKKITPKTGLLMTILCVIFMKGNCATEEDIWEVLNVMGIYDGRKHFIYGEPRKLLTQELVQEQYLEYRQVPNTNPPRYEFLWGPRAHMETSKMKVLEFLAKIHDTVPTAFPSWYEEAAQDEEARAQVTIGARAPTRVLSGRFYF